MVAIDYTDSFNLYYPTFLVLLGLIQEIDSVAGLGINNERNMRPSSVFSLSFSKSYQADQIYHQHSR